MSEDEATGSFPLQIERSPRIVSQASTRSIGRSGSESTKKKSSSRKSVAVNSNFIKAKTRGLDAGDGIGLLGKLKMISASIIQSRYFTNIMALVVLVDAYCTCWDIDARAASQPDAGSVAQIISDVCLMMYTIELTMVFLVSGLAMLKDWTVLIDITVVACGFVEMIISDLGVFESVSILRILRIMRIVRLSRLLRKTRSLRELQKLVRMMATCLKALMWSFVFCFMIMTVWAMLIVEWIYPLIQSLHKDFGTFDDCPQCLKATSSVMDANLLLFKTVIAGDSWGLIAVPVIEAYPATAVIFVGSLLTLVFGVLNLIVAVVVDNFAEARQRDVLNLAEEMEDNLDKDTKLLEAIFQRIDEDGSGQVTFEELVEGARKDKEFQSRLRVMDIDEADLQQLFEMIDTTGEGQIEASQFIAPMTRWVHESKTAPRFIKYNMLRTIAHQEEFFSLTQDYFEDMSSRIDCIAEKLGLDIFPQEDFTSSFQVTSAKKWSPTRQVSPYTAGWARGRSPTSSFAAEGKSYSNNSAAVGKTYSTDSPRSPQRSWNLSVSPRRFGRKSTNPERRGSKEAEQRGREVERRGSKEAEQRGREIERRGSKEAAAPLVKEDSTGDLDAGCNVKEVEQTDLTLITEDNEPVEQPHCSTTMPFSKDALAPLVPEEDASLKTAMQKLESLVVDATRSAVKASLGAVENALQDKPRDGDGADGRRDNIARLLHMFESLQQGHSSPRYPRHHPMAFIQRRGTDEGSLLSSGAHRSKESPIPFRGASKEEISSRYQRHGTDITNNSAELMPSRLPRLSRHSQGPGSGRPLIGGFSPPGTASSQIAHLSPRRSSLQY